MVVMLRHDIMKRGVTLSGIPARLRRVLIKERWFRIALLNKSPAVEEVGVQRCWPVVTSEERPPDELLSSYEVLSSELLQFGVELARGVKCRPFETFLSRSASYPAYRPCVFRFECRWVWRWPAPLWRWWNKQGLPLVTLPREQWLDDHRDLASEVVAIKIPMDFPPPQTLLLDAVRPDGVNWV
jgi:hypothetical protein